MMKENTFMKRSLALILSAVLLLSNLSGLSILVNAADDNSVTTTVGQIVADNYALTEAEKAILASGCLVSDEVTYVKPGSDDGLVTVDTENAKITAASKDGWTPVKAVIKYGNKQLEVKLTNGVGTYDANVVGNAFSVEVTYQLTTTVDKTVQQQLLNAPAYLQQGIANLDAVAKQAGNLLAVETALPTLLDAADNGLQIFGGSATLDANIKNAIYALNEQASANNGKLNLSVMISDYEDDAGYKTEYLIKNGNAVYTDILSTKDHIATLAEWLDSISGMFSLLDEPQKTQLPILHSMLGNLNTALADLAAADWTAATLGTDLVYADADYAKLDTLVAALGELTTGLTIKEELLVATTVVQTNLSMYNVTIKAEFYKVDANNKVTLAATADDIVLTLAAGLDAKAVNDAIAASGVYAAAEKVWGDDYVAGKFNIDTPVVKDALEKDITVTIKYTPNNYKVTVADETKEYPYGYALTLPKHSDPTKAYDYKDAKGNYLSQGTVVIVTEDAVYTRTEGTAYVTGNLLDIIADNANNEKLTAILSSGALTVNENVNYRVPTNLDSLVTLKGNKLTAATYPSDYEGLNWAPYSYVVDGKENLFNGATEVTISGDFEMVQVYYRLTLTNYTKDDVQNILNLVNELVEDAAAQKGVLDSLANYRTDMSSISKAMFDGLGGMIAGSNISEAMKEYFTPVVANMAALCFNSDGTLKLYTMLNEYADESTGGLVWYYQNSEAFLKELNLLSGYMADMLDSPEKIDALTTLLTTLNYGHYVDKLSSLSDNLNRLNNDLTAPNAAIDTTDAGALRNLTNALTMKGSLSGLTAQSPYLELGPVNKTADKYVSVGVTVVIDGKTYNVSTTVSMLKGGALTAQNVADLKASIAEILKNIDGKAEFYNNDYNNGAELDALVGVALNESKTLTYTWTAKVYTVVVPGTDDQTITINNLTINLPKHNTPGMKYEYIIGNKTVTAANYTFTAEELRTLFVNGSYTVTRIETNEAIEKLENMVSSINQAMGYEALTLVEKNGVYTGIVANLNVSSMMDFVQNMVLKSGYSYIGLNGEGLVYTIEEGGLEVSIQTLLNAILNDKNFSSNTLIALGQNGKGVLLNTSLQLGDDANTIVYEDLSFTINVTSVPSQFVTAANALNSVKNYVQFHAENGQLVFDLTLPNAVYGAYLTALVATGNVDKDDVNGIDQAIAFQFLYDYFDAITSNDAITAETFTNTIAMLGRDVDLTKYSNYYDYFCKFLEKGTEVEINSDGASLTLDIPGKPAFDGVMKLLGIDPASSQISTYLPMLREYKEGARVVATAKADLKNPTRDYNAMVVDLQAAGIANKYAFTTSHGALADKTAALAGYSAIMLMGDVNGDLTISGTTVLDLNGYVVKGDIKSTGKLYIIDSSLGTYACGGVTGSVSGSVVILGGNFKADVSDYLKAGYYQDGGYVRNELFYIESDENDNATFVLNSDFINSGRPSFRALAIDIAADLVLNYAVTAALTADGCNGWIYDVNFEDLLGLLKSDSTKTDLIDMVLGSVSAPAFADLVNMILDDVLDFEAIAAALASDSALATYTLTTAPWNVSLDHITDGDYLTLSINANHNIEKTYSISLKLEGSYTKYLEELAAELADIAYGDINVYFQQPEYLDKVLSLVGSGDALGEIDITFGGENREKHEAYLTMLGVILAYGNPDKAEDIAAALNGEHVDQAALKTVFDATTVAEIFTALKAMSRTVDFAAMAKQVGVTNYAAAAELEDVYHIILCAVGKALETADITGTNQKVASVYDSTTGWYIMAREDIFREGEYAIRSYAVDYSLTADSLKLTVKLFTEYEDENPDVPFLPVCDHEGYWSEWFATENGCSDHNFNECEHCYMEYRYCTNCYAEQWQTSTKHEGRWQTVKEATEKEEGLKQLICIHCGKVLDEEKISKLDPKPENPKDGDTTIMIVSALALASLMALAVVEFGFKRKFLR